MKKFVKVVALSLAISFSFAGVNLTHPTNMSYAASKTIDFGYKTPDAAYRSDVVKLEQTDALKKEVLGYISEVRAEMWDENPLYTYEDYNPENKRLQDVAAEFGITTKAQYAYDIHWNQDLEKFAIQRAYEVSLTHLTHARPDGENSYDAIRKYFGDNSDEYFLWDTKARPTDYVMDFWTFAIYPDLGNKSLYDLMIESKGVRNWENYDFHNMLYPGNNQYGYGKVLTKDNVLFAVMIDGQNLDSKESTTGLVGNYKMYVGNPKAKALTTATKDRLRKAIKSSKEQYFIVDNLLTNYPNTVKKIEDRLYEMLDNAYYMINKSYGMLGEFDMIE